MNNPDEKKVFLQLVNEFNNLMNSSVEGPNCTNPDICHSDCCHIMIDIPKYLVDYYIESSLAKESFFVRGNVFSFKIAVNPEISRCIFYDRDINGCGIHKTLMKPLHCWIYPTGFDNEPSDDKKMAYDGTIMCKRAKGWKVIDEKKAKKASQILKKYIEICTKEFVHENTEERLKQRLEKIEKELEKYPPKSIAGFKDSLNSFIPLKSEGMSLKLKKICDEVCIHGNNINYFECKNTCDRVSHYLADRTLIDLINYVRKNGAREDYSFQDIW